MAGACLCGHATCLACCPLNARAPFRRKRIEAAIVAPQLVKKLPVFSLSRPKRKVLTVKTSCESSSTALTDSVPTVNNPQNLPDRGAQLTSDVKPKLSYLQNLIAGAAAGATVSSILFPINTIKTRVMAGGKMGSICLSSGLWRGVGFDIIGQAVTTALFFGTYGIVHETYQRHSYRPSDTTCHKSVSFDALLAEAVPSVSASLLSSLLVVPNEAIRQNVQAHTYPSTILAFKGILKERGVGGFYRGYRYSLMRDVPFDSLQFTLYQVARNSYLAATGREQLSRGEAAVIGGGAGALTGIFTTPVDVIKTQRVLLAEGMTGGKSLNMLATVRSMVAKEGFPGLFKGAGPRAVEIALGGVIFFSVLEQVQKTLLEQSAKPALTLAVAE